MVTILRDGRSPREKVLDSPQHLEDWELLSIIFGSGIPGKDVYSLSREILSHVGGLGRLPSFRGWNYPFLKGLGKAKRAQLIALSEIARRIATYDCKNSQEPFPFFKIYQVLRLQAEESPRETLFLITFSPEGTLLRLEAIARGSLWEVGISKRELVRMVLDDATTSCILAHNHPSQSAQASWSDKKIYFELGILLQPLDIQLIDHWVVGEDGLYSCRKNGFLDTSLWQEGKLPEEYQFLADNQNE